MAIIFSILYFVCDSCQTRMYYVCVSYSMFLVGWTESDVCRRQIQMTKVDPRTVRVKIFLMAVDP